MHCRGGRPAAIDASDAVAALRDDRQRLAGTVGVARVPAVSMSTLARRGVCGEAPWPSAARRATLSRMAKRARKATSKPEQELSTPPPRRLDLGQFDSVEDALSKIEPGDRYLEVGKIAMRYCKDGEGLPLTLPVLFWFSMITRSQGLHDAIVREIAQGNPHAVFPLIRAFAESVVLAHYVSDHPEYVKALIDHPRNSGKDGPRRKTIQALIAYAKDHAPGMKDVYAELSEATHFGSTAMWASVTPEEGEHFTWASSPRWRSDEQALIACAQTLELAGMAPGWWTLERLGLSGPAGRMGV